MVEACFIYRSSLWLFPNAIKTYLIVKPQYLDSATALFQGTNVQITCLGQWHLGAAIGSRSFTEEYVSKKVKLWCNEILTLSTIAKTHPHSTYAAFVHGVLCKWNYVMHTVDLVGSLFQPLKDAIHEHFIPALTERDPCSVLEQELLALSCRFGGLNIPNPTTLCEFQFSASKKISDVLASLILELSNDFSILSLHSIKSELHQSRHQLLTSNFNDI